MHTSLCSILCSTLLLCTVLYCTAMYVRHSYVCMYGTAMYCMHGTAMYCMYGTAMYCMYGTVIFSYYTNSLYIYPKIFLSTSKSSWNILNNFKMKWYRTYNILFRGDLNRTSTIKPYLFILNCIKESDSSETSTTSSKANIASFSLPSEVVDSGRTIPGVTSASSKCSIKLPEEAKESVNTKKEELIQKDSVSIEMELLNIQVSFTLFK